MTKSTFQQFNDQLSKTVKQYARVIIAELYTRAVLQREQLSRKSRNKLLLNGLHGQLLARTNSYGYYRRYELRDAVMFELLNKELIAFHSIAIHHFGEPIMRKLFNLFDQWMMENLTNNPRIYYQPEIKRFVSYDYPGREPFKQSRAERLLKVLQDQNNPEYEKALKRFQYLPMNMSRKAIRTCEQQPKVQVKKVKSHSENLSDVMEKFEQAWQDSVRLGSEIQEALMTR